MHIRQATIADLDTLAALFDSYRQYYEQTPDLPGARAFLSDRITGEQSVILIAQDAAGHALGFTQLYPSFTSTGLKPIFILNDLFVTPEARQQGVASALLKAAAAHARTVGAARLTLSTAIDNLTAQGVYESNGWQRETRFLSYTLALN